MKSSKSSKTSKKKDRSSPSDSKTNDGVLVPDSIPGPHWIPPSQELGGKLLDALEYRPLDDRDLFGVKVYARVLKHLSPNEVRDLMEVFNTFDRDSNGFLKATELSYAMKALGFSMSKKECDELIAQESMLSGVKGLCLNEFFELIIDRQHTSKDNFEEILTAFRLFDYESTGLVRFENLRQACLEANVQLSDGELRAMIQEADTNGDSMIDQNEFISIMLKTNLY